MSHLLKLVRNTLGFQEQLHQSELPDLQLLVSDSWPCDTVERKNISFKSKYIGKWTLSVIKN